MRPRYCPALNFKETFHIQTYFWNPWSIGCCQSVIANENWGTPGPLRSADWWSDTDVSEHSVGPCSRIKQFKEIFLGCFGHEMWPTACSETSIPNHQSALRKIQKRVDLIYTAAISWNQTLGWWNISCIWTGICGAQLHTPPPTPGRLETRGLI